MPTPVIQVKGLAKKYRLGKNVTRENTLFQSVLGGLKQPFTNLRQIRGLTKIDEDDDSVFWALRDVEFEVNEGDVLGVIGNNGAGKSTLLKILSQITEPSEGEVRIQGRVAALLEVGTGFHPELTGRQNIYMNGTILGMTRKEIDRQLEEIIEFSGIEKHIDTPSKFYSSGMRVRLGFSVAAHLEPEILIIDEVLAVGDGDFQKKCLGKMEDVAKTGRTVLFVSHNMMAVKSLCTRGILLDQGKIVKTGKAEEVVDVYLNSIAPIGEIDFANNGDPLESNSICLLRIAINSKRGDGTFNIKEAFSIDMNFSNQGPARNLHVNLFFNTTDGANAFVSHSSQMKIANGKFHASCIVSPDLLNDIYYSLDVMVVEGGDTPIFHTRKVITIQGIEPPRQSVWMGKLTGIVRPELKWKIDCN